MRILSKKLRIKRLFTLLGVSFLILSIYNFGFSTLNLGNERKDTQIYHDNTNLKNSKISNKIHIKNWSDAEIAGICTGSGTFSNPYLIKDLIIDGGGTGIGIFIEESKNYYFKIENCTIFNCTTGIKFELVNNGTLYRNNCSFNNDGISVDVPFLFPPGSEIYNKNNTILENIANNNNEIGIYLGPFCNNSKIIGNTVNNNNYGISLLGGNSHNNIIKGNIINRNHIGIQLVSNGQNSNISNNILYNNEDSAIAFLNLGYNLTGNLMKGSGLALGSASIEGLSLLKIDTSNLVNSKHIYYYVNKSNLKQEDFFDAGQIFLINCHNSTIANVDVSYSTVGISLFHSNNITVIDTNSSNNKYGVRLSNTNNSYIIRNILNENYEGIQIEGGGKNNTIYDNNIEKNIFGIFLHFFNSFSKIYENVISGNLGIGLYLEGGSNDNTIFLNFFRSNGLHVGDKGLNNNWNNSEIGNYWDNYTGVDANGDGIGDTPHNISISPLIQDYLPIVDIDPPNITIIKPSNNSVFGNKAPSFEIKVYERFLDVMWYTLDSGLYNYTFTENGTIDQAAWNLVPNGQVELRFYAVDKVGYIAYEDVMIIKEKEAAIPGYNLLILLGIFLFFCFTLIKIIRNNEKKIRKSS